MSEDQVLDEALEWCRSHQLLAHACGKAIRCHGGRGFPDFWAFGTRGWLVAEIKQDGEEPRGEQVRWKYGLLALGLPYRVWHVSDWPGRITAELEAIV